MLRIYKSRNQDIYAIFNSCWVSHCLIHRRSANSANFPQNKFVRTENRQGKYKKKLTSKEHSKQFRIVETNI